MCIYVYYRIYKYIYYMCSKDLGLLIHPSIIFVSSALSLLLLSALNNIHMYMKT